MHVYDLGCGDTSNICQVSTYCVDTKELKKKSLELCFKVLPKEKKSWKCKCRNLEDWRSVWFMFCVFGGGGIFNIWHSKDGLLSNP